jgi:starvation-inducible DNA-binding protein
MKNQLRPAILKAEMNNMSKSAHALKITLASTFSFYLKAHSFHWNVRSSSFSEHHKFFEELYNETWEATDAIAEHIRALGEFTPAGLHAFAQLSVIEDENQVLPVEQMFLKLAEDNRTLIQVLTAAFQVAESEGEIGLSNFLQDRVDIHKKHGWMIESYL